MVNWKDQKLLGNPDPVHLDPKDPVLRQRKGRNLRSQDYGQKAFHHARHRLTSTRLLALHIGGANANFYAAVSISIV